MKYLRWLLLVVLFCIVTGLVVWAFPGKANMWLRFVVSILMGIALGSFLDELIDWANWG